MPFKVKIDRLSFFISVNALMENYFADWHNPKAHKLKTKQNIELSRQSFGFYWF